MLDRWHCEGVRCTVTAGARSDAPPAVDVGPLGSLGTLAASRASPRGRARRSRVVMGQLLDDVLTFAHASIDAVFQHRIDSRVRPLLTFHPSRSPFAGSVFSCL